MSGTTLLIDAARTDPEVGLMGQGRLLECHAAPPHADDPRGRRLVATIAAMLAAPGAAAVAAVAVVVGPGPLTGTRLGLALARGLAGGWGVGLIGLPAWFRYADPAARGPQSIALPIGRAGVALAQVTVHAAGWRLESPRFLPPAVTPLPTVVSRDALALAAQAGAAQPPGAVMPLYLREADATPQVDGLGRPLAATSV